MKSRVEYRLYTRFQRHAVAVRIATFFSERAVRKLGNEIFQLADEVYYKIRERRPDTKAYVSPKRRHKKPLKWESRL